MEQDELTHDHGHLTRLVFEVRELTEVLRRAPADAETRSALSDAVDALHDDLATHFAKEEEGLFPFVAARIAAFAPRTERLASLHDALCGAISRLGRALHDDTTDDRAVFAAFERFEVAYAEHSQEERALLDALPEVLAPADLAAVRALLAEL